VLGKLRIGRSAGAGKIPGFSRRNREFHRFSRQYSRLSRENREPNQVLASEFP
jgi:hypothetical protein